MVVCQIKRDEKNYKKGLKMKYIHRFLIITYGYRDYYNKSPSDYIFYIFLRPKSLAKKSAKKPF